MLQPKSNQINITFSSQKFNAFPIPTHPVYHSHSYDEMLIILSGDIIALTQNTYLSHKGACILFYKKNCAHAQINNTETAYERYYMQFDRGIVSEFFPDNSLLNAYYREDAFLIPLNDTEPAKMKYMAHTMLEIYENNKFSDTEDIRLKLLLCYIFAEITEVAKHNNYLKDINIDQYLISVVQYISENISQKITIKELSTKFHVGRTKLTQDFKKYLSMTISEYITMERLVRARLMLQHGETLGDIVANCGFTDIAYFIRIFKKYNNMTPAQYRRKYNMG